MQYFHSLNNHLHSYLSKWYWFDTCRLTVIVPIRKPNENYYYHSHSESTLVSNVNRVYSRSFGANANRHPRTLTTYLLIHIISIFCDIKISLKLTMTYIRAKSKNKHLKKHQLWTQKQSSTYTQYQL